MRHQTTRSKRAETRRDWVLLLILFTLNLLSGSTTVIGAQQVLPRELAWLCGIAVQVMLFCLLSGFAMKRSIVRRAIAVTLFSAISIYTSFFCYYDVLSNDVNERDQYSRALELHRSLVAEVYTPFHDHVRAVESDLRRLEQLVVDECEFGVTTGIQGCGDIANKYRLQASEKKAEYGQLESTLDDLEKKFNFQTKGMSPTQIYESDLSALSSMPEAFRKDFKVVFNDYIDRDLDFALLAPYYKVFKVNSREDVAVVAFLIAFCVDGMAILQGTAIEMRRERKGLVRLLSEASRSLIRDLKTLFATIDHEAQAKGVPIEISRKSPYEDSSKVIRKIANYVHHHSGGDGAGFLTLFRESISENPPHWVDVGRLTSENNHLFRYGFTLMIGALRDPSCRMIRSKLSKRTKKMFIREDSYSYLLSLIEKEIFHFSVDVPVTDSSTVENLEDDPSGLLYVQDDESFSDGVSWLDIVSQSKQSF